MYLVFSNVYPQMMVQSLNVTATELATANSVGRGGGIIVDYKFYNNLDLPELETGMKLNYILAFEHKTKT